MAVLDDWGVKAFGALATFLAVFVALFGSRLQHWINPPKLTIRLADADGWPAVLHVTDLRTNTAQQTNGFWYHVRVDNKTRWKTITGVYVFLLSMELPDAAGEFQSVWNGYEPLGWRNEPNQQPKSVGYHAECDVCHILNEPRELRISPLKRGQVQEVRGGQDGRDSSSAWYRGGIRTVAD
jgi:hypothetical protein